MERTNSSWGPILVLLVVIISTLGIYSCKHDPFMSNEVVKPMEPDSTDISNPTDPEPPVDTSGQSTSCDSTTIYFGTQILPILQANCAVSGCHDAQTASEEIILDSYENLINSGIVDVGSIEESDLYEVLVEDNENKRMPPPPAARLDQRLINLIGEWIKQGAQNLECDNPVASCDTVDISFTETIKPILQTSCVSCHTGNSASGGVRLDTHAGVKIVADNGKLVGAVSWESGYQQMPQGGVQLPDCQIDQISAWVNSGALNN